MLNKKEFIMNSNHQFSREIKLKDPFNSYWNEILSRQNVGEDLYKILSIDDFIKLKQVVSNVNNIITLQTTLKFVDFLFNEKIISADQRNSLKSKVLKTNANTNGFDVDFYLENCKFDGIIAEVKCNIPVAKHSFGANQEDGLIKDLKNLQTGKTKAASKNTSNYLKFMVVLESKDSVKESMRKIIKKITDGKIVEYEQKTTLSNDTVYVVYIPTK